MKLNKKTKAILKNPQKRQAWIIFQTKLLGTSLAAVGRKHGVTRNTMYMAFHKPYPRVEKIISDLIGTTPQLLFPERYNSKGMPNREKGRPKKNPLKNIDINSVQTKCKDECEKAAANF